MSRKGHILAGIVLAALALMLFAASGAEPFEPVDLPVIYLHLDGGEAAVFAMNDSADHSVRCTGKMDIVVPDGYDGGIGGAYPQGTVKGLKLDYIRGRGNGSWGNSKKPYKIKLEEKTNLFGLGKNKHWVLMTNYDASQIRNWITGWMGERLGLEFTPMGAFVEVVMNDEYLGIYYLCEQIRIAKTRVAIDELTAGDSSLPAIQGGYLIDFFPEDEGADRFETEHLLQLGSHTPSFNPADDGYENEAQKQYIRTFIQQAEDAVFAADGRNAQGRGYGEMIDLQSLADYWWIMEFSCNGDAFRTDSTHMYKKRYEADGSEGKLYFGPLWDFDDAWGNWLSDGTQQVGFNNSYFPWMSELRKKPEFLALLRARWDVFQAALDEMTREGGLLDATRDELQGAMGREMDRWGEMWNDLNGESLRRFPDEVEHIRNTIALRRQWINEHMDRLGMVDFQLTIRIEGQEDEIVSLPADGWVDPFMISVPEGWEATAFLLEDGTNVENGFRMEQDTTLTVQCAPMDE